MDYAYKGERGGWGIRDIREGWIFESWSSEPGSKTGIKMFIAYDDMFPPGVDWNAPHSTFSDQAKAFAVLAIAALTWTPEERRRQGIKILSRGRAVKQRRRRWANA